jgi:dTDP-4-amino-4,6-dideoxygalactose transaminase
VQVHYIPIPAQPYYRRLGYRPEDYPGAEKFYQQAISLPLQTHMTEADVDRVAEELREILTGGG